MTTFTSLASKLGEKDIIVTTWYFDRHNEGSREDYEDYQDGGYDFGVRNKDGNVFLSLF